MKRLWKRYDLSIIAFIFGIIFTAVTAYYNYFFAIGEFIIVVLLGYYRYYIQKKKRDKLLYQIKNVEDELDFEEGQAFERLSVACTVIEENGKIIWANPRFQQSFQLTAFSNVSTIQQIVKKESIEKLLSGDDFKIKVGRQYFAVYSSRIHVDDESIYLLYFFDETRLRLTEKEYYDTRPSIMHCVIDNSDEIYQNFKESECAAIFSRIEQLIDEWVTSFGGLCRKFSNARMLIFVEERTLQKMISDKFSILDEIRDFTYNEKNVEITLSIGVGKESDLNDANNSARQALDMAQSRGGDQVAIKHEAQYKFYGGVSAGHEKKNKVKTRLISKTITEIIADSDNILIMGHRFSDFDAFGSAVGMYSIAEHFKKKVKIVANLKNSLAGPLIERFTDVKGRESVISPEKAILHFAAERNTLLIIVDTHKKDFTDCPELIDLADKIMVIDHHRKSVDFIDNTVVFYHMPNASSTSEMVTEIVQYVDSKPIIDSNTATALFSGIMLDTRNFIIRTGVRTFEAAAYLRGRGANTVECKKLFSNDMDIFRFRNAIIDKAFQYKNCAISVVEENHSNIRLTTSQAADEMLNIEGVKASFVIYENNNCVNISARSYGETNVQLIMESLGGGGHQTMSACQIKNISVDDAVKYLENTIDDYLNNL